MEYNDRREELLYILQKINKPVSGASLGESLNVSRQVIVQDIAILRAKGVQILATPQGYILNSSLQGRPQRIIAVKHDPLCIDEELRAIISMGGKVLDVIVEHPLYGEIKAILMLKSIADLDKYMVKYRAYNAEPLSALTGGIHLHTIEADSEECLDLIIEGMAKKGFLLADEK